MVLIMKIQSFFHIATLLYIISRKTDVPKSGLISTAGTLVIVTVRGMAHHIPPIHPALVAKNSPS